jgi:hypothetical protein
MKRECAMIYRALIECAIVSLWLLTLPVWAVEYRLQVTNGVGYRHQRHWRA